MTCPVHRTSGVPPPRRLEAARPPEEQSAVQQQAQAIADSLEPVHQAILAGLVGAAAAGVSLIPLAPLESVRRAISVRFASRGQSFEEQFNEVVEQGADIGRATAVRRAGLDVSPTFGDESGGSITDVPTGNPVRSELRRAAERARSQVRPRMIRDISRAITEAADAGLTREEIARRLRENSFPQARDIEARRIAQTELPAAANRGALAAYEDAGVTRKEWLAMDDARTRRDHNDADGQTVPLGETFYVGGYEAQYPGDFRLPPSQRVNCRCFIGAVTD